MRSTALVIGVLGFAFAMLATPVAASPISYTFVGDGGLSGGFILDDEADWVISSPSGVLASPFHTLWGTLGTHTFAGTATLHVTDYTDPDLSLFDSWIVRSQITLSSGGSPPITHLNLFVYQPQFEISLTPRIVSFDQFSFQYTAGFSDGSFVAAPLQSLVRVPESPSFALPVFACAAIAVATALRRRAD